MRTLLLAIVIAVSSCIASAQTEEKLPFPPPAHPATSAQIQQIMTLSHSAEAISRQLKAGIADQEKNGSKFLPASFWSDFAEQIEKTDWLAFFTPMYQRYYSTDDAAEIIRFYSTPAGQKLVLATQPFMTEVLAKSKELGRQIGTEVATRHAAEIQVLMKQANPDTPLMPLLVAPPPPPPPPAHNP